MKRRIVFVDDEPLALQGLQRAMRGDLATWDMQFVGSGAEALTALAERPADLVVADMRMPVMNGPQLLREVARLHPQTVRFILSGNADRDLIFQCVNTAHQFLAKPCDTGELKVAIGRAFALNDLLRSDPLRRLISRLHTIPSPPAIYHKLREQLTAADPSAEKLGRTIGQDPAMTAKILQLVNSAFFGLSRKISSPVEAAAQLGVDTLRTLVLWTHIFSAPRSPSLRQALGDISNHSLLTGQLARQIVELEDGYDRTREMAMTAGLLHDLGKLVLVTNRPGEYQEAILLAAREREPMWEAEQQVFGASHAEVGAYLVGLWGLPFDLVEAVAFHHNPGRGGNLAFSGLTAVHVANAFQHSPSGDSVASRSGIDRRYLASLNLTRRVDEWWQELQTNRCEVMA